MNGAYINWHKPSLEKMNNAGKTICFIVCEWYQWRGFSATVLYLRHWSTKCAAVSSFSVPSGTFFSSHIRSCMTATASLTCGKEDGCSLIVAEKNKITCLRPDGCQTEAINWSSQQMSGFSLGHKTPDPHVHACYQMQLFSIEKPQSAKYVNRTLNTSKHHE